MKFTTKFTILGCGSSMGVPRVGIGWGDCDPANPKNRRRRCSLLVEQTGPQGVTRVLIDTTPDLREQLLDAQIDKIDGVLFTHEHADHTHGIDDLRPLFIHNRRQVDVWADEPTAASLRSRFDYVFETPSGSDYPPILKEHRLHPGRPIMVQGQGGPMDVLPVLQDHGAISSIGFRFGNVAYSTDLKGLPPGSEQALAGLDIWIVDALRRPPHPSHFNLEEALQWIARVKPKRAILTDLHSDLDYEMLRTTLPPHIVPAYDGLSFEC
jgi:phosphoribosyl 1,2-cyclic phosphate phosphodiesterase